MPETQTSNTSSRETQTETQEATQKPEKSAVNTPSASQTQEMEFVTRVNTQTGQKTLHWKKATETAWQGSDGSTSSDNFPQHSITRGSQPPTGFENLYTPNNATPSQSTAESTTPKKPEIPSETAQNFEPTGDIDAETAKRDQEEMAKYKADQAKKTPEQIAQERREAKELFDLGRGDTSGVTEVT